MERIEGKEIENRIIRLVSKFKHENKGDHPSYIILDPKTIYSMEVHIGKASSSFFSDEFRWGRGTKIAGMRICLPKGWDEEEEGQIIKVL